MIPSVSSVYKDQPIGRGGGGNNGFFLQILFKSGYKGEYSMETIGVFLDSQPFIALFLVIDLGYAVGQIKIGGLSLGIGAVLFVGLGVGAIAPKAAPPGLLGTVGLVLFLYGIGIQYGRDFFKGLINPLGIKANLLAAFAVLTGCAVAAAMARFLGFGSDFGAGSMTSAATLQAAKIRLSVMQYHTPSAFLALFYVFI
jgi:uncharacterized transporter YbjL